MAAVVLVGAAAAGLAWRRWDGRLTEGHRSLISPAQLGQPLGTRATLLQFSAPACAPCRTARQLLADVAAGSAGVTHIEIDVTDRPDLVRALDIRRAPTIFVLDPQGKIARRASGLPRRPDIAAAVALATGGQIPAVGPAPSSARDNPG